MKNKALKAAFLHTVPVMTGYLFLGAVFGMLLSSKGYHAGWAVLMSICIYAGSMQFVAINILTGSFNILNTIFMTLMINARHIFYGLSMLEKFKETGSKKPYMIFSLTDETYSLLCSVNPPDGVDKKTYFFMIAFMNHLYWIAGSALGGLIGSALTFNTKGLDFVMTALFVVIFINQWKSEKNHFPALAGVCSSVICLIVFGADNFILPSMLLILISLITARKRIERRKEACHLPRSNQ